MEMMAEALEEGEELEEGEVTVDDPDLQYAVRMQTQTEDEAKADIISGQPIASPLVPGTALRPADDRDAAARKQAEADILMLGGGGPRPVAGPSTARPIPSSAPVITLDSPPADGDLSIIALPGPPSSAERPVAGSSARAQYGGRPDSDRDGGDKKAGRQKNRKFKDENPEVAARKQKKREARAEKRRKAKESRVPDNPVWDCSGTMIVIDTNIILAHLHFLKYLHLLIRPPVQILVPKAVLKELDALKIQKDREIDISIGPKAWRKEKMGIVARDATKWLLHVTETSNEVVIQRMDDEAQDQKKVREPLVAVSLLMGRLVNTSNVSLDRTETRTLVSSRLPFDCTNAPSPKRAASPSSQTTTSSVSTLDPRASSPFRPKTSSRTLGRCSRLLRRNTNRPSECKLRIRVSPSSLHHRQSGLRQLLHSSKPVPSPGCSAFRRTSMRSNNRQRRQRSSHPRQRGTGPPQ